jgi:hypothetical protein
MSYKVTLRDRTEIVVPQQAGSRLKEYWLSLKRPTPIDINGEAYSSSEIVSIRRAANAGELPLGEEKQLPAGPKYQCGEHSLQHAINKYAKQKREVSNLSDEAYRDRVRTALLAKYPNKFCDYKTNTHVCQEVTTHA